MKLLYEGKTKNVYALENGNAILKFKDDVTGTDGVFDPGANTVGLSIEGMGKAGLRLTTYFFELLRANGIRTHYVSSDIDNSTMEVLVAEGFGTEESGAGIEVICRFKATGSFIRRYGKYVTEGQALGALVEVTIKDDERGDPLITKDALATLGILSPEEYETLKERTQAICHLIKNDLKKTGCELYDIKLEFGKNRGEIILIDEISGGNMRVYKNGEIVEPLALASLVLEGER